MNECCTCFLLGLLLTVATLLYLLRHSLLVDQFALIRDTALALSKCRGPHSIATVSPPRVPREWMEGLGLRPTAHLRYTQGRQSAGEHYFTKYMKEAVFSNISALPLHTSWQGSPSFHHPRPFDSLLQPSKGSITIEPGNPEGHSPPIDLVERLRQCSSSRVLILTGGPRVREYVRRLRFAGVHVSVARLNINLAPHDQVC